MKKRYDNFLPKGYKEGRNATENGREEYDLIFEDVFDNDYDEFYEDGEEFSGF